LYSQGQTSEMLVNCTVGVTAVRRVALKSVCHPWARPRAGSGVV